MKSHTDFPMVSKSTTLNNLERRIERYLSDSWLLVQQWFSSFKTVLFY